MDKGSVRIENAIVHILDSNVGVPVLSDEVLTYGSEFGEFLKEHIFRTITSDEAKKCKFVEGESEVLEYIKEDTDFVTKSKKIAEYLYDIMCSNIAIPAADVIIAEFEVNTIMMLAILKMNYKTSYTHSTSNMDGANVNSLIVNRAILPTQSQKLSEAAIINLSDFSIRLLEKKYEVNGAKTNYFSELFMKCNTKLSQKAKLDIVTRAVEQVQKEYFEEKEQFEEKMKAKSVIHEEIVNNGEVSIPEVAEKVFENKPELKEKFKEKIEKYNIAETEPIVPVNETTTRKYEKQSLVTDTGIEIKIPMEQYNSTENIEFLTNPDGTISVLIKNISNIVSK